MSMTTHIIRSRDQDVDLVSHNGFIVDAPMGFEYIIGYTVHQAELYARKRRWAWKTLTQK